MLKGGGDETARLYGEVGHLVEISIEGKKYRVPERLELLRCFQYLDFQIAYEQFCWNATCENCAANLRCDGNKKKKKELCCQTPALEGMAIEKLPDGVRVR
jgi:hypothetical protein